MGLARCLQIAWAQDEFTGSWPQGGFSFHTWATYGWSTIPKPTFSTYGDSLSRLMSMLAFRFHHIAIRDHIYRWTVNCRIDRSYGVGFAFLSHVGEHLPIQGAVWESSVVSQSLLFLSMTTSNYSSEWSLWNEENNFLTEVIFITMPKWQNVTVRGSYDLNWHLYV